MVIHDGVRPLVQNVIISENIRIAKKYGCAMTVKPVVESVCITKSDDAGFEAFKKGRIHTVLHRLKPLNWGYWKRYMKKF